jgi:uncharacterized membrane protein
VRVATITYSVILVGAFLWCGALVLPPLLLASGWYVSAGALYQFFQPICHQLPDRSFSIAGYPLAVCIRCSAIYFGFLAGSLVFPLIVSWGERLGQYRIILCAVTLPMVLDVALDISGLHGSTDASRLYTGALFGVILPFFILPVARDAVQELVSPSKTHLPSEATKGTTHA